MISKLRDKNKVYGDGVVFATEYVGLSTDTKPTGVNNGSTLIEMDTSNVYIYDAENEQWRAL